MSPPRKPFLHSKRLLLHNVNLLLLLAFWHLGIVNYEELSARSPDAHLSLRISKDIGWRVPFRSPYRLKLVDEISRERVLIAERPSLCFFNRIRPASIHWNPTGTQVTCAWLIQDTGQGEETFEVSQLTLAATSKNPPLAQCGT